MTPELVHFIERPNLLSIDQCRCVIDASLPHLSRSTVTGNPRPVHAGRTSWECTLQHEELAALLAEGSVPCERALQEIFNIPSDHRETWRVVRYQPGQEYTLHYDWFSNAWPDKLVNGGQRTISVIIYLCDVDEGGCTAFPRLSRSFNAERGKLLAWNNVDPNGQPLHCTIHSGVAPISGDKWILSTWYRQNPIVDKALVPV